MSHDQRSSIRLLCARYSRLYGYFVPLSDLTICNPEIQYQ